LRGKYLQQQCHAPRPSGEDGHEELFAPSVMMIGISEELEITSDAPVMRVAHAIAI